MKINLIQTVIVILVCSLGWCLHLQQQPRMYDPDQYLTQLQAIQDQLRYKLNEIKQSFQQLDQAIENAAQDSNQQLRLLQEGIADERDSLFQIQQYISLPWSERSCKCFNFSQDLRNKLKQQLANVTVSLNQVDSKAQECKDCAIAEQIRTQILSQKAYLKIIDDTINSKCCKIYTILFNDNLNVSNWMYGNFTPAQYQAWIAQKIKNATTNDTFVKTCPLYTPFTSDDLKTCTVCKEQDRFFNLKTRQCQQCPIGKIFNFEKHRCQYDVVCPAGSIFNQDTVSCQKLRPDYNDSVCPPEAPVWNPQSLGCFRCNQQTPYFDKNLNKCTSCPIDFVYDASITSCRHKDCESNQVYNPTTKLCQKKVVPTQEVSNSYCPIDRPYWDKDSLSCTRCPLSSPYYNVTGKKCQSCPTNTTYDSTRNSCVKQCPSGQQLNPVTFSCENIAIVTPVDNNDKHSICPPDRPIWSSQTLSCSQCQSDLPFWNQATKKCQKCPLTQKWNEIKSKCQLVSPSSNCPPGTVFNSVNGQCQKSSGVLVACPPDRPLYNSVLMACTQCPLDKPHYDGPSNQCLAVTSVQPGSNSITTPVICSPGYYYDPATNLCKILEPSSGGILTMCPPSTPVWDSSLNICTTCPEGQVWSSDKKVCILSGDTSSPLTNSSCDYNYQWDIKLGKCIKCLQYQKYDTTSKTCVNFCKIGEVYDSNYGVCSSTVSRCPVGLAFDQQKLTCFCQEGPNFKYNQQIQKCEIFCKSNEYFNQKDQKCYPI